MTIEQREKIQHAIQALIDVESVLVHVGRESSPKILEVQGKLHEARLSLIQLNAPDYN